MSNVHYRAYDVYYIHRAYVHRLELLSGICTCAHTKMHTKTYTCMSEYTCTVYSVCGGNAGGSKGGGSQLEKHTTEVGGETVWGVHSLGTFDHRGMCKRE